MARSREPDPEVKAIVMRVNRAGRYLIKAATVSLARVGLASTGERLILEPLRVDHAAEMTRVLGAQELYRFTGGRPPTEAQLRARYARQVAGTSPDGSATWRNWVVRRRADGAAVGWIQATLTRAGDRLTAELAWTIAFDAQRRGYAREAAARAVAALRGEGVVAFSAHVHPGHAASMAVARSLGMVPTEQMRDGELLWQVGE
jgi:RimJ/RimL family protein N-acetyltransferase